LVSLPLLCRLCSELNLLVAESTSAQLAKLEELKNHLDMLNGCVQMRILFQTIAAAWLLGFVVSNDQLDLICSRFYEGNICSL